MSVWLEALFATFLVGAAPVVILCFVPLGYGDLENQKPNLRIFLSFAAGGLLGDTFLHLLPHTISPHQHDHNHDHQRRQGHSDSHQHSIADLSPWLWTLTGIITFLMLEKFFRAHSGGGHSHGHSHQHAEPPIPPRKDDIDAAVKKNSNTEDLRNRKKTIEDINAKSNLIDNKETTVNSNTISAAGYLNLAADFSHNFTDGLAIGATFLRGNGWQTTLAMFLHEVPHEIGDFAILIQSGFTRKQAMATQLLTAIGAMLGTVIGLLLEGSGEDNSSVWITPFTAGGFIYIACTSVLPELLEDSSFKQSMYQLFAMITGISFMLLIALNE